MVVLEEHFLEARLAADQVRHLSVAQRVEEWREASMDGAGDDAVLDVEVADSLGVSYCLLGDVGALGELELNSVEADAMQLGQVRHPDQPPRADDPDLVADMLDLGEDV